MAATPAPSSIADRANAIALEDGQRAIVFGWKSDVDVASVERQACAGQLMKSYLGNPTF